MGFIKFSCLLSSCGCKQWREIIWCFDVYYVQDRLIHLEPSMYQRFCLFLKIWMEKRHCFRKMSINWWKIQNRRDYEILPCIRHQWNLIYGNYITTYFNLKVLFFIFNFNTFIVREASHLLNNKMNPIGLKPKPFDETIMSKNLTIENKSSL